MLFVIDADVLFDQALGILQAKRQVRPMTKARPAMASVPLLTARGLLSIVLGTCAFPQNARPADTLNPSLFQLQHTSWTERDGAPPQIYDISQAPDGSLWLGSGEGLYRFDGFTFERVRSIDGDSPAPTEILVLHATSNGDLWVGTTLNGAILLRNGEVRRFPKFEGLPLNTSVHSLANDLDETIWAGTALGLQRFDGSQWRNIGKAWGVPEMVRYSLQLDSEGTLWAEAFEHGLFRLKRGSRHFEQLSDPFYWFGSFFDQSPSGENWASTRFGICPFAEALMSTSCQHWALRDSVSATPFGYAYHSLTFDRRGNLWMNPMKGGGIGRLDAAAFRDAFRPGHPERKMESFTKRDGLTSDQIHTIFRDRRDGSIWVGTDHGLDHFRESPFVPVFPERGTNNFGIQAQKDGRIWIGSDIGGGLLIASPGGETAVTVPDIIVSSLYETQRGTLWFATIAPLSIASIRDGPNDGKTTSLPLTPELRSQLTVQSIVEDRGGAVWASFIPYGLAKWEGGQWIKNGGLTGLPEAWVVILNTGPDGRLWAGYMNGEVAVVDGTSVRRYGARDGVNIGPVAAILSGRSDCWLAGPNGMVRFDGQRFHLLSEANNRPLSGITGIAQARNGDLWLNAFDGVRRVAAAELWQAEKNPAYAVHSDLYDLTDGLPSVPPRLRPFPTAVSSPDGRIWFGLRAGVVSVDPEDPSLSSPVPPVSIARAIADGNTFNATNAKLAARTKNLEIDYSAVSLNRASRVRFRYKLEGIDTGWRDAGSRRQAFYNDLPPGKFQFVVSASNGDNLWNEEGATMNIEVPPAFNQTTWFRSLCVAAFLVLLFALYRVRLLYLTKQFNTRLEVRVSERTRIARDLHDTLLQSFQGLLLRFQTAYALFDTRPADAKDVLGSSIDQTAQAITEGREAVQGLRASTVESNDLAQAITTLGEQLAAEASSTNSVGLHVEVEGTSRNLHPIVRDEIYWIASEALRNAFRHAEARQIEVEFRYDQRQFRLRVRDDGKGIDAAFLMAQGRAGHFGLQGMRERAKLVGGKLTVWTAAGSGTEIEFIIPAARAYGGSSGRSWFVEKFSGKGEQSK
jgi:signal transduction histidine kinase/ligand-binding sensor domain-containing protein